MAALLNHSARRGRHSGFSFLLTTDYRQFNNKLRSARAVGFGADATAVVCDDALDDGEAEARAPTARRKIGLKEAREIGARDAVPGVRDFCEQQTAPRIV